MTPDMAMPQQTAEKATEPAASSRRAADPDNSVDLTGLQSRRPQDLLALQRHIGNRATSTLVTRALESDHLAPPPGTELPPDQKADPPEVMVPRLERDIEAMPPPPSSKIAALMSKVQAPSDAPAKPTGPAPAKSSVGAKAKAFETPKAASAPSADVGETRSKALTDLKRQINTHGVSGGAANNAQLYINQIFGGLKTTSLGGLAGKTIDFHVIPADKQLTDLAEFASLKGTTTFDGRVWDTVRGIYMGLAGDLVQFAVGEEDLVATPTSGYGPGFVASHESGHGLDRKGLNATQHGALTAAYTARKAAHNVTQSTPSADPNQDEWLQPSWYSAANENEYFASGVSAWFSHPYDNSAAAATRYTRAWLKANDLPLYNLLDSIYATQK